MAEGLRAPTQLAYIVHVDTASLEAMQTLSVHEEDRIVNRNKGNVQIEGLKMPQDH